MYFFSANLNMFLGDYISCSELYGYISKKVDMVILDARSSDDYRQSSMKVPYCVNIPEEIIKSGYVPKYLSSNIVIKFSISKL